MEISRRLRGLLDRYPRVRRFAAPALWMRRQVVRGLEADMVKALDRLMEHAVSGDIVVRVGGFPGQFEMDVRSHVLQRILLSKVYEPEIAAAIRDHVDPARDAVDVGANAGLFTMLMASLLGPGGRVLAVEPTPNALRYLRRNIDQNGRIAMVQVFEGAAAESEGEATISIVPGKEEYSSLAGIVHTAIGPREARSLHRVATATLDGLVDNLGIRPGLVKIDTEGAEYLVFKGAARTLLAHRPVLVSELSDNLLAAFGHTAKAAVDLLVEHGYRVYDLRSGNEVEHFPFNGDILAIPR